MTDAPRTQVAIIGAGPAGLLLGHLLNRHGVETVIIEARSRAYCEARIRAGVLEQGSRDTLVEAGVGERLEREGLIHGGIYLRFDGANHRIPMDELTGRSVTVYGQTEVTKDLIQARINSGAPLQFECEALAIDGLETDEPSVSYRHAGVERRLRADCRCGL